MVEVASPLAFEDSSWEKVSHFEVQKDSQKFGTSYGVGRKVTAGKTLFSAKLPAASSATGKTVKLGLFATPEEATAAVQHALQKPGFYFQDVLDMAPMVRETEVLEPSFCERDLPMKRDYREKQARKEKAQTKKSIQRDSQVVAGQSFLQDLERSFETDLKDIKSWSRFSRALNSTVSELLETYFPKKAEVTNLNEAKRAGASDFAREVLIAMWHHENDGKSNDEWSITSAQDFINNSVQEGYTEQYGSWIDEKVYRSNSTSA